MEKTDPASARDFFGKCTDVRPDYAPAWLNLGTNLAEAGDLDGAASKFTRALLDPEVATQAAVNLGLVDVMRANKMAVGGDLLAARDLLDENIIRITDTLKEKSVNNLFRGGSSELDAARQLLVKLKITCGQVLVGMKDMARAEEMFRDLTISDPETPMAWAALKRVLEMGGGDTNEIAKIGEKMREFMPPSPSP